MTKSNNVKVQNSFGYIQLFNFLKEKMCTTLELPTNTSFMQLKYQ